MAASLLNRETLLTPQKAAISSEVQRAITQEATKASLGLATGLSLVIGG